MISAEIVADSINEFGNRITTMKVVMPRYILAEFNTHRMFSRNSASSRAIPFQRNLESIDTNPFIPIAWMKDHKGMQGTEYYTDQLDIAAMKMEWLNARYVAIIAAKKLAQNGLTKQLVNRLLEPFMWHTILITATEFENFFYLRCPQYEVGRLLEGSSEKEWKTFRSRKQATSEWNLLNATNEFWFGANKGQADIHMMATAEAMWDVYNESTPKQLKAGEWHIPYEDKIELPSPIPIPEGLTLEQGVALRKVKIATTICARISYTTIDALGTEWTHEKSIKKHDDLAKDGHWSPFEHCAKAMTKDQWMARVSSGNFKGFIQYRKTFEGENK